MKNIFLLIFIFFSIYSQFVVAAPLFYVAEGVVFNEDTQAPIADATIIIQQITTKEVIEVKSNSEGKFTVILQPQLVYWLKAKHPRYFSMIPVELHIVNHKKLYALRLPLKEIFVGKALMIEHINFNINDTTFAKGAKPALEKFYSLLTDNQSIVVEIAVHTDARGNDDYNLSLTQQRATYIVDYLIGRGIASNRLIAKGYGETRLVNHCGNNIKCSSNEHAANRRVEFIVIEFQ